MKPLLTLAAVAVLTPLLALVRAWDDLCIRYDDDIWED